MRESLLIHRGDSIVLSSSLEPADSTSVGTHRIGCTLAGVLADVRTGERIWFDDGKIGGVITAVGPGELTARITSAAPQGSRLRAEKGINLPDSRLSISALTEQDIADLEHVRELADIVSMSFVRSAADVRELLAHLDPERDRNLDILLKIETVAAFKALARYPPRTDEVGRRRRHDRARGPRRGSRVRTSRRGPGGNPVALRSRPRSRGLGHPGARHPRPDGQAVAGGSDRRRHGPARRVRHAQQGSLHQRGDQHARGHSRPDAGPHAEEKQPAQTPPRLGRRRRRRGNGQRTT